MTIAETEIREIVDRETRAWDTQDVDLLMTLFHPDMVWPWPPSPGAHDPAEWVLEWGRFDDARWREGWGDLFEKYRLIHNRRETRSLCGAEQQDGAFAVVEVDTLWRDDQGEDFHWQGRAYKIYTRISDGQWKMIGHTGLLNYP